MLNQPVNYTNPDSIFPALLQLIDKLMAKAAGLGRPLLGIGVGSPGLLNVQDGSIQVAVNLGWHGFPLKEKIEARYQLPVYVFNDSQAAAHGQFTFDNPENSQDLIVLKVGRGISAGIVMNGKVYSGSHFGASEIGHLKIVENGTRCQCGHFGCLETVASSGAVVRQVADLGLTSGQTGQELTMDEVLTACHAGQQAILDIVEEGDAISAGRLPASSAF